VVDVGRGQLHAKLRAQPQVISFEETDIRAFTPDLLRETPDLLTVDVSFISLKLVLPAALKLVAHRTQVVALIKPQFEAGPAQIKKGIVRDASVQAAVCADIPTPITGGDGNAEFLLGANSSEVLRD